jgi:hypothetical protein
MRIFILCFLALTMTAGSCSTGDDCGPFPERSQFALDDTVAMRWTASSMFVAVPWQVGNVEITRWPHLDSIRVIATHRGESSFDTLVFEHLVIDTLIQLRLASASEMVQGKGATVECTPAPDPYFDTDLKIFAPDDLNVEYRQTF